MNRKTARRSTRTNGKTPGRINTLGTLLNYWKNLARRILNPGNSKTSPTDPILDAIDRKIDLHQRKREVHGDPFKALLHKLMTGEIRVGELAATVAGRSQSPSTRRTNRGTRCSAARGCQC